MFCVNEKCFGLRPPDRYGKNCGITESGYCVAPQLCPFYKPKWKFEKDLKEHDQRLRELPASEQRWISEKYYNGKAPWLEETI